MNPWRRKFTLGACTFAASPLLWGATPARQRAVIVGGGWGGLAAARQLARQAPDLEVVLVERSERFVTLPVTNRWLVGLDDGKRLSHPLAPAAAEGGYHLLQRDVTGIDRERRLLLTDGDRIAYDWLLLSPGIREEWTGLAAGDAVQGQRLKARYSSAFTADADFAGLKARLARFSGGNFLMNIPPAPYRCPPAPYERAIMLAWFFKSRGLKSRLTLIEPNAPWPSYQRIFRDYFAEQITYLPQTRLLEVDPEKRIASLEVEDIEFDDALLMPAQQAGEICWQAGLIERSERGQATGWSSVDPLSFQSRLDPRIFVVGDCVGRVSPLFGYYPKTGQMAARMGVIAANQIAALSQGRETKPTLPDSTCYAQLSVDPPQTAEIVAHYSKRGDGLIIQDIRQRRNNQPADEADVWLDGMLGELFGPAQARSPG